MNDSPGRLRGAASAALVGGLAGIARNAGGKEPDKVELAESVRSALAIYACVYLEFKPSPLRKFARPIADVLKLLKGREHEIDLISTLRREGSRMRDRNWARLRLLRLIEDLEQLEGEVRVKPSRRTKRGRPGNPDLHRLVHELASGCVAATGKPFTQMWHNKEPLSPGAQFVEAAVRFLDPKILPALPNMTERVVADRLEGKQWVRGKGVTSV